VGWAIIISYNLGLDMSSEVFSRVRFFFGWPILSLLFAMLQLQLVIVTYQGALIDSLQAARGVYDGTPHWMIFQSRILGPYLLVWLTSLFGDPMRAFALVFIVTQASAGYLISRLAPLVVGETHKIGMFFMFQSLFSLVLVPHSSGGWLYVWDLIGINVFIAFLFLVVTNKDWRYFLALFVVAIINRESAVFISAYMMLDPLTRKCLRRAPRFDWAMFLAGGGGVVFGWAIVNYLRAKLLVRELGPSLWNLPQLAGKSVCLKLSDNLQFIEDSILGVRSIVDTKISLFIVIFISICASLSCRYPSRYMALAICHGLLVLSLLSFAVISEVRIFLELVPFTVFGTFVLFYGNDELDARKIEAMTLSDRGG
jgi:hypothetical protein